MFSNLFRCVVEDNKDPKHLGRVKIRVVGVHDKRLDRVPVETLPWSEVLNPLDSGNTFGSSTNILQGTWGYCSALNESLTEFLFIGTIRGTYEEKPKVTDDEGNEIGFRDPDGVLPSRMKHTGNTLTYGQPQENDVTQPRLQIAEFKEPDDTANNAVYPNNKVYEDQAGNIMEIDGTKENPRFRFQHSTGTRIEINVTGDVIISSPTGNVYQDTTGLFALGADGNLIIDCDVKITGSLETGTTITAGTDVTASGGEIADNQGNLSSLRTAFDTHTHPYNAGPTPAVTPPPTLTDPLVRTVDFTWKGTPN